MKKTLLILGTLLLTAGSAFAYSMPRWGMTSIDVYLPEHENSGLVRSVFEEWSSATGGRVKFRYQTTRFASNNAQIRVEFQEEGTSYYLAQAKRSETTGYFTNMDDGFINRATLIVYSKTRDGREAPRYQIKANVTTEVGYILGLDRIFGRCDSDEDSVMCISKNGTNSGITEKDIKDITRKYDRSNEDIKGRKHR